MDKYKFRWELFDLKMDFQGRGYSLMNMVEELTVATQSSVKNESKITGIASVPFGTRLEQVSWFRSRPPRYATRNQR